MTITLNVEKREESGKRLQALRADGKLPAVMYGPKVDSVSVTLDKKDFEKAFHEAGESTVLVLKGLDGDKEVLVHDVEYDVLKGGIKHVDFYAVTKGEKVTVNVPVEFAGEAPAVKLGGSLTKALHEVEVTGEPSKLPHEFTVDVSSLETFEDSIRVKDLEVPKGVEITNDPEETIAVVTEAKEEVEPEEQITEADVLGTTEETKEEETKEE